MKNYFLNLKYLLRIHISGILAFTLFRMILLIANTSFYADADGKWGMIAHSLLIGLRFDNVVACYLMLLPLGVVLIASLMGVFNRVAARVVNTYFQVMYILAFMIEAVNIPYFKYFFNHLNASIYNWLGYTDTTLSMALGEVSYYVYLAVFLAVAYGWIRLTNHYLKLWRNEQASAPWKLKSQLALLPLSCILIGLTILGLRGSIYVSPIRTGAAFFCQNPFFNQVGNNPIFNLVRSTLDLKSSESSRLRLMDDRQAIAAAKAYLGSESRPAGPILCREVRADSALIPGKPNVVLIFMESMSAELMDRHGNGMGLTPFLDSLSHQSIYFDHFYSAGNHTNQGVYSTLYSHPSILKRNMMKSSVIPNYYGLPSILKENGYQTVCFVPHEAQYDNMNGFMLSNGFEKMYAQEDFPPMSAANCWGVSDEFLLDYSVPVLTEYSRRDKPFFGVIVTVSNHPPYVIPEHFRPKRQKPEEQIVEFADYALARFFDKAKQQPWYENTVFVLVADHGKIWKTPAYSIPTSFNHIPLIIYSPRLKPQLYSDPGGQIDVGPTLLGMLGISYQNVGFGVDLLREKRPCMFFASDNAIGCMDREYFYIYKPGEKTEQLFHYPDRGTEELNAQHPDILKKLKDYSWAMMQTTQYVTDSIMANRTGM